MAICPVKNQVVKPLCLWKEVEIHRVLGAVLVLSIFIADYLLNIHDKASLDVIADTIEAEVHSRHSQIASNRDLRQSTKTPCGKPPCGGVPFGIVLSLWNIPCHQSVYHVLKPLSVLHSLGGFPLLPAERGYERRPRIAGTLLVGVQKVEPR